MQNISTKYLDSQCKLVTNWTQSVAWKR